ncbi:hypothetical protein RHSP_61560 [Rhizobium freirei PRF 81]|uniref:Virulence factor Evf domain-containing protein n=1 Tax=Rhizobium freirei PRF 81 TaxID=363754 RepID=N6VB36_9HYPH|nr:hypothetical protein [Rhizobium freirei]ENN88282.1 hypothetical protein RHSP_61560 [Rhizobium freirei PRF 81]
MSNESAESTETSNLSNSKWKYEQARTFFTNPPLMLARANGEPQRDDTIANAIGTVQFHLIGQKVDSSPYREIMDENRDILLALGGLVYNYIQAQYPTVDAKKLNIDTWAYVVGHLPDISTGRQQKKSYSSKIAGAAVPSTFLSLIANAHVSDGVPLQTDFSSFLTQMGDLVFSADNKPQRYKALTCTYQCYLGNNGVGGYYDYSAIVLREFEFKQNFLDLKSSCSSKKFVDVDIVYTELAHLVQTRRLRRGGADYENFQRLISRSSTEQFKKAKNFFNQGSTPQQDIQPQI